MRKHAFKFFAMCIASSSPVRADSNDGNVRALELTCPTGGIADESGYYCCLSSCGECGGQDCDKREGGEAGCCISQITKSCLISDLPCYAYESFSGGCPDGGIMDETETFCCSSTCGGCGGYGCELLPGWASECCTSYITRSCSIGFLPCKMDVYSTKSSSTTDADENCPSDGIFDETGKVCCAESCGQCGGYGCDSRPGGASQCCTSQVSASCSTGTLPCIIDDQTSSSDSDAVCSDGILSEPFYLAYVCEAQFCCPKKCPFCNTNENFCFMEPECCAFNYLSYSGSVYSDVDISCRNKSPPCLVPLDDDPCIDSNPCQNGARCGNSWGSNFSNGVGDNCFSQLNCECEEVGNYYGEFCEYTCDEGETPCGEYVGGYDLNNFIPNDKCCSVDEVCINTHEMYYNVKVCKSSDRPLYCVPDPCLNGGTCYDTNVENTNDPYYGCLCMDGFSGVYCEIEEN